MDPTDTRIRLGISSCLLGEKVRYDGGHKRDGFLADTLSAFVDYVTVCPEFECGFGVPREAFRLVGDPESPRLMTQKTGIDCTDRMLNWAQARVRELEKEDLDGFIFKSKSPSSGMERVKVYQPNGQVVKKGVGLFARVFKEHFPLLPTEEEGRLHDLNLRRNFIEQVFVVRRWKQMTGPGLSPAALIAWHARHKLVIMAHSPQHLRTLGHIISSLKERPLKKSQDLYFRTLMEALGRMATQRKNTNVLQHIMGYFKKDLTHEEKMELLDIIGQYHGGLVPLIVPVTLLNHYTNKYGQRYLQDQYYLHPHPRELMLLNHA